MLEFIILEAKHCKVYISTGSHFFLINLENAPLSLPEDEQNVKFKGV